MESVAVAVDRDAHHAISTNYRLPNTRTLITSPSSPFEPHHHRLHLQLYSPEIEHFALDLVFERDDVQGGGDSWLAIDDGEGVFARYARISQGIAFVEPRLFHQPGGGELDRVVLSAVA